jgi:epoxyqueuosine reductase QueG
MTEPTADMKKVVDGIEADVYGIISLDALAEEIRARALEMLPGAKAIIVMGQELFPEVIRHLKSKGYRGELTLRDTYGSHAGMVSGRLNWQTYKAIKALHRAGYHGFPLTDGPFDARFLKGAISYPHLADLAGLGYRGWHSFLITPEFGPRLRLAAVLTDAPLTPTKPDSREESYCEKCSGACVKICPAGAIKSAGRVDQKECRRYETWFNPEGEFFFGCWECRRVCPA